VKIASIVGTRPQFIKLAPLSRELRKQFEEVIIHTGQHYDRELDGLFFEELDIPQPDYNLQIGSGTHGYQTAEMMKAIEGVLINEDPDVALVFGDSNSTLAGALTAIKMDIPVGHVEAGVRTYELYHTEEINRVCVDHMSEWLFAITNGTYHNLRNEGIPDSRISVTGSTLVDACLEFLEVADRKSSILDQLELNDEGYYLFTAHRAENVDFLDTLKLMVEILTTLDYPVVFPIHPRTKKNLKEFGLFSKLLSCDNVILIPPLGYLDILKLIKHSFMVLSDSGGIQQEAIAMRKKLVWLRSVLAYPELQNYRGLRSVSLGSFVFAAIESLKYEDKICSYENPLGEGDASGKIARILSK